MDLTLNRVRLLPAVWWGGLLKKICLKPKGIVVLRPTFFYTILKFLTRVEGGIGGPNTPAGALGSPVKTSPNLLAEKNQTLILVPVLRLLLRELYGPTHILTIFRNGAERLNSFKWRKIRRFQPVSVAAGTLEWFVKIGWAVKEKLLRQNLPYDCRSAKRFYVRRTALVAHFCRANRWFLSQIFK